MTDWSGRRVLVTGAGGFIGSHLTEHLIRAGAETRALVHYNSRGSWGWLDSSELKGEAEIVAGDVTDSESVGRAMRGVNVVFHLAALIGIPYSYQAAQSYVRVNVDGTLNVLQAALALETERVVHTSTSETYGSALQVPISEDHPLQAQSPYAASKIAADKMVEAFGYSHGLPASTVRPFNTYGPRQSARAVIPTIISQCLDAKETIELGNLEPTRDLNFIADTVKGFVATAESERTIGEVVNLGSGSEVSIADLAGEIVALTGSSAPVVQSAERVRVKTSEVDRLCADSRKVHELTGWEPEVSLRDGLQQTIEWMRANQSLYRPSLYAI